MGDEKKHDRKQDEPSQEFQNFQRLLSDTLSVPKKELDKRRAKHDQRRAKE